MKTFKLQGGKLISLQNGYNGEILDVYCEDGIIKEIGNDLKKECETIDISGNFVSAGFIDTHVHCYGKAYLGVAADSIGVETGVTSVIDAGSSGCDNYEDFRQTDIKNSKTKVFTLLNISNAGLTVQKELSNESYLDVDGAIKISQKYCDNIVGIKARSSSSVVGEMGIKPIEIAKDTAAKLKLPLVVHLGNKPPTVEDTINLMQKGDVATHVYNGKENGLLTEDGKIKPEFIKARERGVYMDSGHGSASFNFDVYKKACELCFSEDTISTDLHSKNINGPVFSLADVATKFLNLGESLSDVINKITYVPAKIYSLNGLGEIKVGAVADFTVFNIENVSGKVSDSDGFEIDITQKIVPISAIVSGGNKSGYYPVHSK